jgi:hypothetical protein
LLVASESDDVLALYPGSATLPLNVDAEVVGLRNIIGRGTTRNGENGTYDSDFWTFSALAGDRLLLTTENTSGARLTDREFDIYGPGGNQLTSFRANRYGGVGQNNPITIDYTGRVVVEIRDRWEEGAEYRINANLVPGPAQLENEDNSRTNDANAISFRTASGMRTASVFGAVSKDWAEDHFFLGNLAAGTQIQLQLTLPDDSLLEPRLRIYRDGESPLTETADSTPALDASVPVGESGDYYAVITGTETTRGFRATYLAEITLRDTIPPEILGSSLPASASSGFFSDITLSLSEDFDVATVNNPANYSLVGAGANGTFGDGDDFTVAIGTPGYSNGTSADIPLAGHPLPPGLYRFTATTALTDSFGNALTAPFEETFEVGPLTGFTTETVDDGTGDRTTTLALGGEYPEFASGGARGRIVSDSDIDVWQFAGTTGQELYLDIDFPGSSYNSELEFELRAPDGTTLQTLRSDNGGDLTRVGPITLAQDGDYEVRVSQWDDYRGEYRFRASLVNDGFDRELEPNDAIAEANTLTLTTDNNQRSGSISGFVESTTDRDYFALGEIQAGETIFLSADVPGTSPLEPVVSVYDATDTFVGEVPTGRSGDGVGEVSILTTGDYYALVRPSGTTGGLMSEYRLAVQAVPTDSANFANLQVASVTLPGASGITSGDTVAFDFTVENIGADATVATSWIDRVVISTNTIFGDGDDYELAALTRTGSLAAGDAYTVSHSSDLPEGIEGSFYLIVRSDTANQVDEFLFEGDNVLASGGTFTVNLADYPDLLVEQLQINDPGQTGDLSATWQTANRGNLDAANGWTERVQVIDLITQGVVYDNVDSLSQSLAPDATLARSLNVSSLPASNYRLRVTTDFGDDYFEYDTDHTGAEENTVTGDFLVYRYFDLSVTAEPTEGGSVSGGGTYREGSSVTVTATADTSGKPYSFVRWKDSNGTFLTTNPSYTFTADENADLVAEFELPLYTVETSQNIAAGGSVSGAGGYRWGTAATLTARPAPGYLFERWEDADTGTELGTSGTLALTIDGTLSARAIFAEENPTHDVTVTTSPANVATLSGDGTYNNGETLNLSAPVTVVDGDTEYLFQQWTLNGGNYAGQATASVTFATTQPATLDFVAQYKARSYLPEVIDVEALRALDQPIPADTLFGVTLTFDRAMNTSIAPTLTLDSANAAVVPTLSGGQWLDDRRWESGTLTFNSDNTGDYTLNVSGAEGEDGRVMNAVDAVNFTVDATPPANPNIALQGTGMSTATIEWGAYTAPADLQNFRVYLEDSDFSDTTPAGAVSALNASARQFTFNGLELDKDYYAAIVAVDQAGNAEAQVTSLSFSIDSEVPPPVSVSLQRDAPDSALLDWSGYNRSALVGFAGFRVYRSTSDFSDVSAMTPVATLPADATNYRTASLDRTMSYHFAVVGFNRLDEIDPAVTTVEWTDPLAGVIDSDLSFGGDGQRNIDVLQSIVLRGGATLTIRPGTTLRFAPGTGIAVENGKLDAVGTAFEPIIFTSDYDRPNPPQNPAGGDWLGIELLDGATASAIEHAWILYAQGILLNGADPQLSAVGAVRNSGAGLTVSGGSNLTGDALYLAFNDIGLAAVDADSSVAISNSVLLNNTSWAAQSATDASIEATASWWGTDVVNEISLLTDGPVQAPDPLDDEPLLGLDFALAQSGVQTTNDQIDLRLATMNASALRLSEDSTFAGTPFEDLHDASAVDTLSYAAYTRSFSLSAGAGVKTIFAEFLSPTGGLTEILQLQIELLADGPEITGFNLSEGQVINRPLDVVASAASPVGIDELRLEVDGSTELSSPADALTERWDIASFDSGVYRLRLVALDRSGNLATRSINVTIDPAPPNAPVIDAPANDELFTVDTTTVSGMAEPNTAVRVTVNGGPVASGRTDANGAFSFSTVPLDEGQNEIIAIAEDAAGSASSAAVSVVSDTKSPQTVEMEEPVYDPDAGLVLQWRFLETEGERPVEFKVYWATSSFSDSAAALAAGDRTTELSYTFTDQANQRYYFRVVGYDAANNVSALSNEVSVFFDDTPPVIEIFYDKSMPVGSGDLQITVKSNEALESTPGLTIQPEGRRLPISVPLAATGPQTWASTFTVSDASMRSGEATVLVSARDQDSNLFSGAPDGPALLVDLTRPTGVLRINELEPVQVLDPRQIELTLELTEPVAPNTKPSLRWSPPSGAEVDIPLEGSEDRWTGELTLFPNMGKGEGTFLLEATDAVGNTGTLLTEGAELEIYNTTLPDPPARPGQLAAATRAGGEIDLEWLPAEKAHTYNVYRVPASQSGIPNNLVEQGINGTTYTDLPPADGQYRYVVTASRLGAEGEPSPSFTVTSDRTPPQPPQNALAQFGLSGVEVSFDAPAGGETPARYVLYRNGSAIPVTRSTSGTLRDYPPRGVMEYQVASADVYGNHALSNISSIEMFLAPVKDLEVLLEAGEPVRLAWASNDNATEGYHLYRNGVRQNDSLLNNASYIDPLSLGGSPVTYAVTAVDDQGRESVRRQLTVQPLGLDFLLNPDDADEEFPSVARYFDRYALRLDNTAGDGAVALSKVQVERTLANGDTISREFANDTSVPGGGEASSTVVLPAPLTANLEQTVQLTLESEADTGGGKVRYRMERALPGAESPDSSIRLAPAQPPLAGGTTDFEVTFTNRGRSEADFVLTRGGGSEPGEFGISVLNDADQEVAFNPLKGVFGGMQFNGDGDGFFRLAPGESASLTMPSVFVPEALGDGGSARFVGELAKLYYKTGDDAEQISGSLRSELDSNLVETPYYGTSSTPRTIYSDDETIVISGQSLDRETDAPVGNKELRLGLSVQGFSFYREVTTDANGDYSFDYNPSVGIAGDIEIWAAHPEVVDELDQTAITLYRSLFSPARAEIKMSKNDFLDFEIQLINPGNQTLSDFTMDVAAYVIEDDGSATPINTLTAELREPVSSPVGPRERAQVKLRLLSELDAPDNAVVEITLTSSEGASSTFVANTQLLPAIPVLSTVSPRNGYVDLTVDRGDIESQQVTITNRGLRPLEDVVLTPPAQIPWMQVNLAKDEDGKIRLPDLEVGESLTFGVAYTPPEETAVGFYDDFMIISGSNAVADFRLNLFAQVNADAFGDVQFSVDNNLVQPVPNASVRLRNVTLGIERGPSRTDANGEVVFEDLQAGKWSWKISAPSHQSRAGVVKVIAGQTNGVTARLGKSLVSINFNVTPVPFTDRYEITLEQTFETRVPAPVITLDPPKYEFETNEPFETSVVFELTNHGLISGFDNEINAVKGGRLRIVPLIDYIPEIRAQETIEIPAKIIFDGFEETTVSGGGLETSSGAASPAVLGPGLPGGCSAGDAGEFLKGLAAIAKLGAEGEYECADGDLGVFGAVALGVAGGYQSATALVGSFKELAINLVGNLISCAKFDTSPGGPGGEGDGGPPPHRASPNPGSGGEACFVAGTEVRLADGSVKAIEQLRAGDVLLTGNSGRTAVIEEVFHLSASSTMSVYLDDGSLAFETTPSHRIWVDGEGWKPAAQLEAGDWLQHADGEFRQVGRTELSESASRVYTLQLKSDNAFFANGWLVQDLCGGLTLPPSALQTLEPLSQEGGRQ